MRKPVLVVAAVIQRQNDLEKKILIVRRGPDQSGAGQWEFPGGKVEPGERPEQALQREIQEELGILIQVGSEIGEEVFAYPAKTIRLRVFWATTMEHNLTLTEHDDFQWCLPEEIPTESLSAADRPFVEKLHGNK